MSAAALISVILEEALLEKERISLQYEGSLRDASQKNQFMSLCICSVPGAVCLDLLLLTVSY